MKLETEQLHAPKTFWEVYREEPDRFKPILRKLRAFTKRLEQLPHISFIETEAGSYETALKTVDRHLLLPRDAYHWSIMQDHEVSIIATTDTDFARIPDVTIYTCNEKMLAA